MISLNQTLISSVMSPPIQEFKRQALEQPTKFSLIDLSQAVPNFATFPVITRKLSELLQEDGDLSFYTEVQGLPELRSAIVNDHPLQSCLQADQVLVTAGANHAMFTALVTLVGRGAKVLLPEPYYFNYEMALRMLGLEVVGIRLDPETGFQLNASYVAHVAQQEGVKAIILITPNNPCGTKYANSEIFKLLEMTEAMGVHVILDETYRHYNTDHLLNAPFSRWPDNLTLVGSFSKSFSLTGYRVGYLALSHAALKQALKVQDTLVICAPHLSQRAALHGLQHGLGAMQERVALTAQLEGQLLNHAAQLRKFRLISSGTFFAYFRHPFEHLDSHRAALWLHQETGILVLPGEVFGAHQQRYLRFSFVNVSGEQLAEAMQRLISAENGIQ